MNDVSLHHPTDDVRSAFEWLKTSGFAVVASRGGLGESFGNQLVELSDGSSAVRMTRDRGQWTLDLIPESWAEWCGLSTIWPVLSGEHVPISGHEGEMPAQLPVEVSWLELLPKALEWAVGHPHREVFVEVERQRYGSRLFGGSGEPPSLTAVQTWLDRLASAIGTPSSALPTFGSTEDFARPHIERVATSLHYVVVERGEEFERTEFFEAAELIERVFRSVSFGMACDWEVHHRHPTDDGRKRIWARQLQLLETLHPLWEERLANLQASKFREVGLSVSDATDIVRAAEADG